MESPRNPFEIVFQQASENPEKSGEFYTWVAKQDFVVPCQDVSPGVFRPAGATNEPQSRRIVTGPQTRIRLKAFQQQGSLIVPFFSDLKRFEEWSIPDPEGQYTLMNGRTLFALIPPQAAVLLNPGSEVFSKWFDRQEIRLVLEGL